MSLSRAGLVLGQGGPASPVVNMAIRKSSTHNVFALIVGSGVAGSSVAFHLAKRGMKDVMLIEKSKSTAAPSGTTYHSPGLVSASHPAHRYKPILAYSIDLYSRLDKETGGQINFEPTGTIRLATNETRLKEFRRYVGRDYYKTGDVCKTSLLGPDEVAQIAPHLAKGSILGALHTTSDGCVSASGLTRALISGAKSGGVQVREGMPKFIKYDKEKGAWFVELEGGDLVITRNLINAAGIWANDIARMSGHILPGCIVEHQYAVITVRFREDWYQKGVPAEGSLIIEPDFSRLDQAFTRAKELVPDLQDAKVEAHAAVFNMTPDGYPLVGPYDKNYWVSTGFLDGVSSGGGIGKYLADWIVDGEPPHELFDTDASRYDRWADRKFILEKSKETYSMYYNWSYTDRLGGRPTNRVSGIWGRLKKEGAQFSFRNGWEVAQYFSIDDEGMISTLQREYETVTNKCGVIDLSWKGKLEIKGPDAEALMDYAFASSIPPLGQIGSGVMLTREGRLFAPMKIFHHDKGRSAFICVTEPERESRELYWLRRAAVERGFKVQVNCVSEYLASLALVGPKSREVLSHLTKADVSDSGFPMRSTRLIRLGLVAVVCARSSTSTGQLSFELFHNRADTFKLYEAIRNAGASVGLCNFGAATLNMMRLEHGYKIWGRELSLDTNPYECGLGTLVNLEKKDFIGRIAAEELSKKEFSRRLTLLTFEPSDNEVPLQYGNLALGNEVIRRQGQEERIGQITSGTYSVRLQKPIAFAWVDNSVQPNEKLVVDVGLDKRLVASIVETLPHAPIF
ncbi:hypothetical protein WR25_07568 [Diploscapter pachys]|uniref:FAD dependent oxidoreductase n=1 Tax=Diploscapter pachys TaxID=2018661 RepID=A0A2A2LQ13_9BILA|nr:hypothetical protein WR25_07568 [Diploscapter pachys]